MQSKTVYKHLPLPFTLPRTLPHRYQQLPRVRVHAHRPPSSGSYDSEGDELLKEFQQYTDPNKLQKITERLELTWSVHRVRGLPVVFAQTLSCCTKTAYRCVPCCSSASLRPVTAVMGQARKSAHGAGAQVQHFWRSLPFSVCTSPPALPVGAMMVGEELFCSLAHGCKQCPICNSKVRSSFLGFCSHLGNLGPSACVVSVAVPVIGHTRQQQLCLYTTTRICCWQPLLSQGIA